MKTLNLTSDELMMLVNHYDGLSIDELMETTGVIVIENEMDLIDSNMNLHDGLLDLIDFVDGKRIYLHRECIESCIFYFMANSIKYNDVYEKIN